MNNNSKHIFARLMANENINVVHGNFSTAFFNMETRTLCLPLWNDMEVYDLLLGHEVGHALYTPTNEWLHYVDSRSPIHRDLINIVEDIRIERLMQIKYPGLIPAFKKGYAVFFERDIFKINKATDILIKDYSFLDRFNMKGKLRSLINVEFTPEEQALFNHANRVETFAEVVDLCEDISAYIKLANEKIAIELVKLDDLQDALKGEQGDDASTVTQSDDQAEKKDDNNIYAGGKKKTEDADIEDASKEDQTAVAASNGDQGTDKFLLMSPTEDEPVKSTDLPDQTKSETFRSMEIAKEEMVAKDDKGRRTFVCYGLNKEQKEQILIPYERVRQRRSLQAIRPELTVEFLDDIKNSVNHMVKEFELKKAAYQFKKASVSKTGTLDVDKLYNYKLSDDLFLRSTKLGEFKDHGMVMLVDYSGSMRHVIKSVIKQVLVLATFCKKINVPFDIYGFTMWGRTTDMNNEGFINATGVRVFQLLSSSMSKDRYKEAFDFLVLKAHVDPNRRDSATSYNDEGYEIMGDTPLNEAVMVMHDVLKNFKKKHNKQKVIFTTLTDGDASYMHITSKDLSGLQGKYGKVVMKVGDQYIPYNSYGYEFTAKLLENLKKEKLADVTLSYFLTSPGHFSSYYYRFQNKQDTSKNVDVDVAKKKFRTDGYIVFDNVVGYDRIIVIRQDNALLGQDDEEIEVSSASTRAQIAKEFKKFAGSKKNNRVIAAKFAEVIA